MGTFAGKTVFVLGLGKTGQSAMDYLLAEGANVLAWDDDPKKHKPLPKGVELVNPEGLDWRRVHELLKSPGVSEDVPAVQAALAAGVMLTSDIDLLYLREQQSAFIGITGTNGKSTTTALIGHLLKEAGYKVAVGGNIGVAPLTLPSLGKDGIYVLELSSYQLLQTNKLRCHVGVLLNLTPDHMERHKTMQGYLVAKTRIFNHQTPEDIRVVGVDTEPTATYAQNAYGGNILHPVSVQGHPASVLVDMDGYLKDAESTMRPVVIVDCRTLTNLPGRHNWENVACAWAALKTYMTADVFVKGLRSFKGLPHRLEQVVTKDGVTFVNDSKATNADAANKALTSFDNIYLIAGGQPKAEGIDPCIPYLKTVRKVYLIGQAAEDFGKALDGHVKTQQCGTLDVAIAAAYADAKADKNRPAYVMLSPACASWDQFANFEERGALFAKLALELAGRGRA
ncbi:MAG: UDP-N-acetylmuramoyl-L-alanine--D-glutamate ligase [Proteobacteria bacterium]|nr:UDP-N-acetylmuramoyl-L-alanine--D-glutamate ligase [Pseudomonadota bacterium]